MILCYMHMSNNIIATTTTTNNNNNNNNNTTNNNTNSSSNDNTNTNNNTLGKSSCGATTIEEPERFRGLQTAVVPCFPSVCFARFEGHEDRERHLCQ